MVKSQRNINLRVRLQIEGMKLKFWWKHLAHIASNLCN
jgi:hypothetical protein